MVFFSTGEGEKVGAKEIEKYSIVQISANSIGRSSRFHNLVSGNVARPNLPRVGS